MNQTSITAKDLIQQVKKLKPEVEQKKMNAEIKSKKAEEEEKKANIVLEHQEEVKKEVEEKKAEADEILNKVKHELQGAEKIKVQATAAVEKLKEDSIREVGGYKVENILKMAGVDKVLKSVLLIVTGNSNLNDLKSTLQKPKNLKQFDLNEIENSFEKYKKICETYKVWFEKEKDVITKELM
jgi:hypothetical protein